MAQEVLPAPEPVVPAPEQPTTPQAAQTPPLTKEEFLDAMDKLAVRARAAGVRPAQAMLTSYLKQWMNVIDGVLGALDEGEDKNKKK